MFIINKVLAVFKQQVPALGSVKISRSKNPYFKCNATTGKQKRPCSIFVQEFELADRVRIYLSVAPCREKDGATTLVAINDRCDRHDMGQVYAEAFRVQDFFQIPRVTFKGDHGGRYVSLDKNLFFDRRDKIVARSVVLTLGFMVVELDQGWDELINLADLSHAEPETFVTNKPST